MPGMSQHPNSEQLQLVIDLTAGMGLKAPQQNDYDDGKLSLVLQNLDITSSENTVDPNQVASSEAI